MASQPDAESPRPALSPARSAAVEDPAVKMAELEAQLAAARVRQLEMELKAEQTRQQAQQAQQEQQAQAARANSSWEALPTAPTPEGNADEAKVQRLVEMGFSRRRSLVALDRTGGSEESAISKLLDNEDLEEEQTPLQQLQAMGFEKNEALRALKGGTMEQAVEELLSQGDSLPEVPLEVEDDLVHAQPLAANPAQAPVVDGIFDDIQEEPPQEAAEEPKEDAVDDKMEEPRREDAGRPKEDPVDEQMQEPVREGAGGPNVAEGPKEDADEKMQEKEEAKDNPDKMLPEKGEKKEPEAAPAKRRRKSSILPGGDTEAPSSSAKAKAKAKAKAEAAPKAKSKASKEAGSMMDALASCPMSAADVTIQARPVIDQASAIVLTEGHIQRDDKLAENAKADAAMEGMTAGKEFKVRKLPSMRRLLDSIGWLVIVLKHGNAAFMRSLKEADVRLPWVLRCFLRGDVDWTQKASVNRLINALLEAQESWKDKRNLPQLKNCHYLFELHRIRQTPGQSSRVDFERLSMNWLTRVTHPNQYAPSVDNLQEILMNLADLFPMLREKAPAETPVPMIHFRSDAAVMVKATLESRHSIAMRSMPGMYHMEPEVTEKRGDIKMLFGPLLQDIGVQWPNLYDDLEMFFKLREIKNSSGMTRMQDFHEDFIATEFQAITGVRVEDVASHLQEKAWRPIQQSDLGVNGGLQEQGDVLVIDPPEGDGVVLRDSEDQLQAFVALGGVERRYQLTAQEKMNEQGEHRFSVKSMSHERTHWYCEGCEKWLDSAGSQYSNSMAKSAIHLHHCHQLDRNRAAGAMAGQAPLPVTSKPKVFDVVKGQNLGCRLKVSATAPNAPRRLLQVYCPILSVLQVSEYAAGISSDRLKAFVRVIRADDEAQAEQDMAQGDEDEEKEEKGEEEAEEAEEEAASSSRPPKRRRAEAVPEKAPSRPLLGAKKPQPEQKLGRFSLLSCLALAEAPARPAGFLLDLHPAQRRTVFWMASREGVRISGFENDTQFPGFLSVQRLSRKLGKSDVKVQVKVERFFENAKGGLLADAVGYGKTAAVLALIALTRSAADPVPPLPTRQALQKAKRIPSQATLVMLPPNLFDQWQKEIQKFLSDDFKVVAITHLTALKNVTVHQLRTADIVLVSLRLLVSKKYQEALDQAACHEAVSEVASKETQYANACSKWKAKETRKRHFDFMLLHRMPHLPEDPGDPGSEPQLADFQEKVVKKALEVSSQRLVRRRWDLRQRLGNMSQAQLKQLDHMTMPPLEIFAWKRLVVDELHEPLRALRDAARLRPDTSLKAAERILFHNFESLEAESRWGLTATPTISSAPEVSFLARFHRVFVPRDSDLEAQHYLDEYVRSNDLDVSTIPIEYHLIAVRHTGGERALYLNQNSREVKDREALLQICNFFSPDDRDDDMSSAINTTRCDNELELSRHRAEMEKTKGTIAELRKQEHENWRNAKNEEEIKKLKGKLRRLEATMPLMEQNDRRLESRKKYFEEVLKELKKLEQANVECPICMTDIETEECSVTACGHLFCQSCITGWLKDKGHKCPSCNHPLQLTGGVAAATEVLSRNQEVSSQARIARFGSKLEAVCNQLKNIWKNEEGAKVIIFVQFEVLRKKMEGALSSLGMSCLTLRGTVFERRRAIRQFHAPGQENQILLLSLERSPAGMNLVCCHHLILVHPMLAESRDAALSFERQAIGRVRRQGQKENVHVYRFYVRDTMEEEMVRAHHQKLLQGQVEREA